MCNMWTAESAIDPSRFSRFSEILEIQRNKESINFVTKMCGYRGDSEGRICA